MDLSSLFLKVFLEFHIRHREIGLYRRPGVWWKCQYGCRLCEKDALHPPVSPDAERAKKVVKEYKTAILLTSAKGKELTDIAVNLEAEAYREGFSSLNRSQGTMRMFNDSWDPYVRS